MAKIDRETLVALRERLVAAEGADRRLDAEIAAVSTGGRTADTLPGCYWTRNNSHQLSAHVTSSVDEATALIANVLPGQEAGFQPCIGGTYRGHIIAVTDTSANLVATAKGATPAIAICAALIDALLTSEPANAR